MEMSQAQYLLKESGCLQAAGDVIHPSIPGNFSSGVYSSEVAKVTIPTQGEASLEMEFEPGTTTVFVGANGSGKTRLARFIEAAIGQTLSERSAHRISGHRVLALRPQKELLSEVDARNCIELGGIQKLPNPSKIINRWRGEADNLPHDDFDLLQQVLLAEYRKVTEGFKKTYDQGEWQGKSPTALVERLKEIWEGLLPHRSINVSDGKVYVNDKSGRSDYNGKDLSDGERAIFYLLGQALIAPRDCVFIVDEPELHIHKALMSRLFDQVEASRQDCAFVYLTHDLDFTASRRSAKKYFLKAFNAQPDISAGTVMPKLSGRWELEEVPTEINVSEQVVTTILGSRIPILFVEGEINGVDMSIFRRFYSECTVIPVGCCGDVIRSVKALRAHGALHRYTCSGIIDRDERTEEVIADLNDAGILILSVSELENVFLIPTVFLALASYYDFEEQEAQKKLADLRKEVIKGVSEHFDSVVAEHAARSIQRSLDRSKISTDTSANLIQDVTSYLKAVDPSDVVQRVRANLQERINKNDYQGVLEMYPNKGLLGTAARLLGASGRKALTGRVERLICSPDGLILRDALSNVLPKL